MKRREAFQRIILAGGTVMILPAALISCSENGDDEGSGGNNSNNDLKIDMSEANYAMLLNDGGFVVVSGIIIANAGGSNWVALSSICTHNGCTVG